MMQALQGYRYTIMLEELEDNRELQEEQLEGNKRLLAGIAVFSAPERVYTVGDEVLGLEPADQERVLQVRLPETPGERP